MTLWGGRFSSNTADAMAALSRSVHFDWRLAPYDIVSSKAYCRNLVKSKVLSASEGKKIENALDLLRKDILKGLITPSIHDEDLHGVIERVLGDRIGDLAGKLRAGRSRNDQIATDLRLYLRDVSGDLISHLLQLIESFIKQAKRYDHTYVSGFTHLQHAQPIVFGHELAKHAHALLRDVERLEQWWSRAGVSPLGSGALAGSSLAANPEASAKALHFDSSAGNSIDAVSDRDFAAEFLFITAMIGIHLSRIGEEWILWSSTEFGWAKLDDAYSTGSSIMPQKKNPDVAELARGKSGRLVGNLTSMLVMLKGLPFAYNRDLQEDKPPLFDAFDTFEACLELAVPIVEGAELNRTSIESRLEYGYLDATTLMEALMKRGMPQRTAHHLVGHYVAIASKRGVPLSALTDEEFLAAAPELAQGDALEGLRGVLGVRQAVQAYQSYGSSAPNEVRKQVQSWKERLH